MPLLALKALFGVGLLSAAALFVGSWIAVRLPANFQQWERIVFALLSGFGLFLEYSGWLWHVIFLSVAPTHPHRS